MNIHVISSGSVFRPAASTNRMLSLARGLSSAGHTVQILCLSLDGRAGAVEQTGMLDGVAYKYLIWRDAGFKPTKLSKIVDLFRGTWRASRSLAREKPDAILVLSIRLVHLFVLLRTAEKHSIPVFHERNEYPHHNCRTLIDKICLRLYLRKVIPRFTGVALMTQALINYFRTQYKKCPPLLHVPMTVEPERFTHEPERPLADRYIAHCGSSFGDKDGVTILVEAFAQIAPEFPDLKLVLIGSDADKAAKERLLQRIHHLKLNDRIVLTGKITRDEIPAWLQHAELLALARPANLQAEGGFPTKLGEYLASSRPVLVTNVGEIHCYLQDGINAWFAGPGSIGDFADNLRKILSLDASDRDAVGRKGQEVALSTFNYVTQGERFGRFIEKHVAGRIEQG